MSAVSAESSLPVMRRTFSLGALTLLLSGSALVPAGTKALPERSRVRAPREKVRRITGKELSAETADTKSVDQGC